MMPPRPPPPFTGRSALLAELDTVLAPHGHGPAVIALHGLGGVGKTRVAAAAYRRRLGATPGGNTWWVEAGDERSLVAGYATIARRLGLHHAAHPEPGAPVERALLGPVQREIVDPVLEWLERNGDWLLVLDGAPGPALLDPFLPKAGPPGSVLVTSRYASWGAVGRSLEVLPFQRRESVEFLLTATGDPDDRAAAALHRELGGLPLALALAADHAAGAGSLAACLDALRADPERMLRWEPPADYGTRLADVWAASLAALRELEEPIDDLLGILSFLAPVPLHLAFLSAAWTALTSAGPRRRSPAADPAHQAVQTLKRYSLVQTQPRDTVTVHRLLQLVIRSGMAPAEVRRSVGAAIGFVADTFPRTGLSERSVEETGVRLVAHAVAAVRHARAHPDLRATAGELLGRVAWFKYQQGRVRSAVRDLRDAVALAEAGGGDEATLAELRARQAEAEAEAEGRASPGGDDGPPR